MGYFCPHSSYSLTEPHLKSLLPLQRGNIYGLIIAYRFPIKTKVSLNGEDLFILTQHFLPMI